MPDAFIYDHVRTPRGRGKSDGALHEVTALNLAAHTLAAVKDRNKLKAGMIDDVVLFDESFAFQESRERWLYTGVTRAAKRLTVVM